MCNYIHMFVGHDHKELVYIIHIFFFSFVYKFSA